MTAARVERLHEWAVASTSELYSTRLVTRDGFAAAQRKAKKLLPRVIRSC